MSTISDDHGAGRVARKSKMILRLKSRKRLRKIAEDRVRNCEIPNFNDFGANPTEAQFLQRARSKTAKVFRGGWPDFMIERQGRWVGVEVKRASDLISMQQARMFAALESAGVPVFVWNPQNPEALTPWRSYYPRHWLPRD